METSVPSGRATTSSITVNWLGTGQSFNIYYALDSETPQKETSDTVEATLLGLITNATYTIQVSAINSGFESPLSEAITVRTSSGSNTPPTLQLLASSLASGDATSVNGFTKVGSGSNAVVETVVGVKTIKINLGAGLFNSLLTWSTTNTIAVLFRTTGTAIASGFNNFLGTRNPFNGKMMALLTNSSTGTGPGLFFDAFVNNTHKVTNVTPATTHGIVSS